jgi:ATP-dependent Clp protease protease subunit
MRDSLYAIYAEATGQSREKIASDCERNKWLTAQEMVEYGLVDRVLEKLPVKAM